MLKVCPRCKQV